MGANLLTKRDLRLFILEELDKIYQEPELTAIAGIIIKTILNAKTLHEVSLSEEAISESQAERTLNICRELKTGKPLQYVLGETFFYNCIIKLNSSTLIPRPETEELVDLIIKENNKFAGHIIDFGSGSGCIAIALKANFPGSVVTGTDISEEAVKIALENALVNNVNVRFIRSDIFNFEYDIVENANIIVSNPPYVRNSEKILMSRNVLEFEPHEALFVPDEDPLIFYNEILKIAEKKLLPEGLVYFEINEALGQQMISLLTYYGYTSVKIVDDINRRQRIIKGRKNG